MVQTFILSVEGALSRLSIDGGSLCTTWHRRSPKNQLRAARRSKQRLQVRKQLIFISSQSMSYHTIVANAEGDGMVME